MFSPTQLRTWTSAHLRGVAWYLECGPQHVPDLEVDMFKSLEAVGGVVLEDEALAGLDDKTCEKLNAWDKLKAEKVKDALEKTRLKEVERKKKQEEKAKEKIDKGKDKTEKGKEKTKKEKGKKTNVQDEVTSTVLGEVLQPKSASNRGTKRDSSHLFATEEHLTLGPVVVDLGDDDEVPIDELIINSSLALLISEDGPKPPTFRDVVSFIEKVMHLDPLNVL
jgi:superfamily II DNA/RNA helicase